MSTIFRNLLRLTGALSLLTTATIALALPSYANPMPHSVDNGAPPVVRVHHLRQLSVFIDDEHNVLTTPCVLKVGWTLHGVGYVTGDFRVVGLTPHGAVDIVTLDRLPKPPQDSEVLDFTVNIP